MQFNTEDAKTGVLLFSAGLPLCQAVIMQSLTAAVADLNSITSLRFHYLRGNDITHCQFNGQILGRRPLNKLIAQNRPPEVYLFKIKLQEEFWIR